MDFFFLKSTGSQSSGVDKIYQKSHNTIEVFSKLGIVFGFWIVHPFYVIVAVIISIKTYIASDYSEESFLQMHLAT